MTIILVFASAPTLASFVPSEPPAVCIPGSSEGQLAHPGAIAVQQSTGDFFVTEYSSRRVQVLGPNCESFSQFFKGPGVFRPTSVAVDNSSSASAGDVYVTDEEDGVVDKFKPKGSKPEEGYEYECQLTGVGGKCVPAGGSPVEAFKAPEGVAVDGSGNLYVAQFRDPIEEFDAEGNDVATLNAEGLGENLNMAVDASGSAIYVDVGFHKQILKLVVEPGSHKVEEAFVLDKAGSSDVTVDQAGGMVYVDDGEGGNGPHVNVFAATAKNGEGPVEEFAGGELGESIGVAFSAQGKGRVYLTESGLNDIRIYVQGGGPPPPKVEDCGAVSVTPVSEEVHCKVTTNGIEAATWYVEYGEPGHPFAKTPGGEVLLEEAFGEVKETLKPLTPAKKYQWRLIANNKSSEGKAKFEGEFETPPAVKGVSGCSASAIGNESATLHGSFEPQGLLTRWRFQYGETGEYGSELPVPPGESSSAGVQSVEVLVPGLKPHHTYHCRLVASNTYGETHSEKDSEFMTTGGPLVSEESFSEVGTSSVKVTAQVNDEGLSGPEVEGHPHPPYYQYEYGPCSEPYEPHTCAASPYPLKTPTKNLEEGNEYRPAPAQLSGLKEDMFYHFRIAATDVNGTSYGVEGIFHEGTFHTFPATVSTLPDERVYEMVTPVENQNANVYRPDNGRHENGVATKLLFEAAAGGGAVAYVGEPTLGGNGSEGRGGGNEYLATRLPGGQWEQHYIQPSSSSKVAQATTYQAFSNDLSTGILVSCEESLALAAHAPGEGYGVLYAHTFDDGRYRPLFTFTTPLAGQAAEQFGAVGGESPGNTCPHLPVEDAVYAGASANLGHLLFEANARLTPDAPGGQGENNLYDSVDGQLSLVNVLPPVAPGGPGTPAANATFGAPPLGSAVGPSHIQGVTADFSHVISANGLRIFWTDLNTGDLYVRVNDATTVPVSAGPARFWTASPDGRYAYYTEGGRLWRFNLEGEPGHEHEALTSEGAGVEGVIGINEVGEDGSYVYFVATGVLTKGKNAEGNEPKAGEPNLYLRHGGETNEPTFIATLDGEALKSIRTRTLGGEDNAIEPPGGELVAGDWQSSLGSRTAEVSPDGRAVVFMSHRSLTGYDNLNGSEQSGVKLGETEVFVYEAGSDALFCASCNPSGEPVLQLPPADFGERDGYVPINHDNTYQTRFISADGSRVFFDSEVTLVPQDTNGAQDVYEWERDDAGSCHETRGCVYLLSGGTSSTASWLLDASESGNDVFIITRAQLVPQDKNENYDVYDVRVGGAQPLSPPECEGTGCQGVPPAPPLFSTPSSVTFNGVGNFAPLSAVKHGSEHLTRAQRLTRALKACRTKRGKRRRAVCEARARKRYGSKPKAGKSGGKGGR